MRAWCVMTKGTVMVGRAGRAGRVKAAVAVRRERGRPETETDTETATESGGGAARRNGRRRRSGCYGKGGERLMQEEQISRSDLKIKSEHTNLRSEHTNLRISGYTQDGPLYSDVI